MTVPAVKVLLTTQRIRETVQADDPKRCEEYLHGLSDQLSGYDIPSDIQSDLSDEIKKLIDELEMRREIGEHTTEFSPQRKQKIRNRVRRVEELFFRHSESTSKLLINFPTTDGESDKLEEKLSDTEAVENTDEVAKRIVDLAKEVEKSTNNLKETRERHKERMDSKEDVSDILHDE